MATPMYWADKLLNKIISTHSNRREFLKATTAAGLSVSALGAISALPGFAGAQPPHNKNTDLQKEIYALMWGPTEPARVKRIIDILEKGISAKDSDLTRAAAEGLIPHAGQDGAKQLIKAYKAFPEEERLQRYLIQLLALNFIVNPKERRIILGFYWTKLTAPSKEYNTLIARTIYSEHLRIIGLMGYRQLRGFQRLARRSLNYAGYELVYEYFAGFMLWYITASVKDLFSIPAEEGALFTFKDRFPEPDIFNAVHVAFMKRLAVNTNALAIRNQPPGKSQEDIDRDKARYAYDEKNKAEWRAVLKDWREKLENWKTEYSYEDPEIRTLALLSLEEGSLDGRIDQTDQHIVRDLLIKMTNHQSESLEVKRIALSIIGSYPELSPDDQNMLVNYLLENPDNDLVLAAARGLRFREGLPAEKILPFLARKKQEDAQLGQHLENLLLSSLDSPNVLGALVKSLVMTDPKDTATIKRRAEELRFWYLQLGASRDNVVRQATSHLPIEAYNRIIAWLRNISMMHIWIPMPMARFMLFPATQDGRMTGEQEREATSVADTRELEKIAKELGIYNKNMSVAVSE